MYVEVKHSCYDINYCCEIVSRVGPLLEKLESKRYKNMLQNVEILLNNDLCPSSLLSNRLTSDFNMFHYKNDL